MTTWSRTLDAAGIDDPVLREDYGRARRTVARFKRDAYLAVRLLVPPALVPHVLAATAFMHETDNLLDSDASGEGEAFRHWEREVRSGLSGGRVELPLGRALAHSALAHPQLRPAVEEFLDGAAADLDFTGFASEQDYQRYIDAYSLPALTVVACLFAPESAADGFRAACRDYIDGSQRLDFVNDLAEDLHGSPGRLTVPQDVLKEFGVEREQLADGVDVPEVEALLAHLLERARQSLEAGWGLVPLTAPAGRPLVRTLIGLDLLTLEAAEAKGARLLRGAASPSVVGALSLLWGEYRLRSRWWRR